MPQALHLGDGLYKPPTGDIGGHYISRKGEMWYQITNYDQMPAFFLTVVSPSNFWLFLSTAGGLTCGRVNCEKALFPYYTEDKIHDNSSNTGPYTVIHVTRGGKTYLWQPFIFQPRLYQTTRNIYKTVSGDKMEFEEINEDLQLRFSYTWSTAEDFGFLRKCTLKNLAKGDATVRILDGMQNILPASVNPSMQNVKSVLVDAYKWSEVDPQSQLGIYCLYALPWDRAEPKESLKANVVYQRGLPDPVVLLSSEQVDAFRGGQAVQPETVIRGKRGAYFVQSEFSLTGETQKDWVFVAEVDQNHRSIAAMRRRLVNQSTEDLMNKIAEGEQASAVGLKTIVAAADGLQVTGDMSTTAHHFANVMFNVMRGGIFDSNYTLHRDPFTSFVRTWNRPVAEENQAWLADLPENFQLDELLDKAKATGNRDLIRLAMEYLPITFSRRHGDPSRPWNSFSIHVKDAQGNKVMAYQGNWRDIFQNWEALCLSYPRFLPSMIAKFVNASTADGYNPYRVASDGIDWEVPDPHDPWSFIGYWGDHQIIYLLKFLESMRRFDPAALLQLLQQDIFAYAHVPYLIRPYKEIVVHPKDTIVFDDVLNAKIQNLVHQMGSDGKLILDTSGKVLKVNLVEKLLVSLLGKLANFVLEGGIWLNTQRPEWNDANNALVGNGVSMVTTFFIRRWLSFVISEIQHLSSDMPVSKEVYSWFRSTEEVFLKNEGLLSGKVTSQQRRQMLDDLGEAASQYRSIIYTKGFGGDRVPLAAADLISFFQSVLRFIDHTIEVNKTEEGLFHSYNVLVLRPGTADIQHLYLMLEGQVCALSSGLVTGQDAVAMLNSLRTSKLYQPDQDSYLLYPDRQLPHFMERNKIPADRLGLPGLKFILDNHLDAIAYMDCEGAGRFAEELSNSHDLQAALDRHAFTHQALKDHQAELLETFEIVFHHKAFTGRSGTMFAYEGLGCIYWHMCSKLLVAVQELCMAAEGTDAFVDLRDKYYEVRNGLGGFTKSPASYGAFPADPHSHTPAHCGAKQPGMTGQVKEEILTRFGELGVVVSDGKVAFTPKLLRKNELLDSTAEFEYVDTNANIGRIPLEKGQLAFTYCQVPVIYVAGDVPQLYVTTQSKGTIKITGQKLDEEWSAHLFDRTGEIVGIKATIPSTNFI